MRGPGLLRRLPRGSCTAGSIFAVCAVALAAPGAAAAFVSSQIESGRLIARSDGGADIIKISCGADLRVKVNGLDPSQGGAACADIRGVRVLGLGGSDTINLSRVGPRNGFTNHGLRHPHSVQAFGGASADRISGSRLSDLLAGGEGHDTLRGRAGDDLLRGGTGSDRLLGGLGDDRLLGGAGHDRLVGGRGNDVQIDL
jgi:Ca2+-binding RTX toxin-like protein